MSTALTSPQYPFDPTGVNPANRVTGELQPLTGVGDRDYYYLIPNATPFFAESVSGVNFKDTSGVTHPLVEGVDYYLSHYFMGASRATGKPVYGSISILDKTLRGTLIIGAYQTVGGEWTVDSNKIAEVLAQLAVDPRTVTWEQVVGYPTIFPPIPHEWNLQDMVGMSAVVDAVNNVVDAILQKAGDDITAHLADMSSNPHHVTASQIGAVTQTQLNAAVSAQLTTQFGHDTDGLVEGTQHLFFSESRVLSTKLINFVVASTAAAMADGDTLLVALGKVQAQMNAFTNSVSTLSNQVTSNATALDGKVNVNRPDFTGLGTQNLVKLTMTGPLTFDITQAEAYQILVSGSGAINFDISHLGNVTGKVIEFAVTTINDNSGIANSIAFPANVKWVDGTQPPRSTGPGQEDMYYFVSEDGAASSWVGSMSNQNPK